MKFQFHYNSLSQDLENEISFQSYLENFNQEIPFIPIIKLKPLSKQEAIKHYKRIEQILKNQENLEKIINLLKELPYIEDIFPHYRKNHLQFYHFFSLGHFLKKSEEIHLLEKEFFLTQDQKIIIPEMIKILSKSLKSQFDSFKLSSHESNLQKQIDEIKKQFQEGLHQIEDDILKETGEKIIYPYGKEFPPEHPKIAFFKKLKTLSSKKQGHHYKIEVKIPPHLNKQLNEIKNLEDQYQEILQQKLRTINSELSDFLTPFEHYYQERVRKTWQYILAKTVKDHPKCYSIPLLSHTDDAIKIKKGVLPSLQKMSGASYNPLNLEVIKGTQVLLGGNMTGKTTVLKTFYFLMLSIKIGLPVTAEKIETFFPNDIYLQLKSSGQLSKGLSSFGEELNFFCQEFKSNSLILIDELFQTTDPVNGVRLSNIFLSYFEKISLVLFCTSQYPDVLKREGSKKYIMRTNESDGGELSKPLFEIEEITNLNNSPLDNKYPLKLATTFPLPKLLVEDIEKALSEKS